MTRKAEGKQKKSAFARRNRTGLIFLIPSAVLCLTFIIYPLITVIYYSMTDWDGMSKEKNFIGLYHYMHVSKIDGFAEMMIATFTFALGVTALTILISFIAALILDKTGRGRLPRGLMRTLWFFPALLSSAIVGILWRIMYNYKNGVINAILKMVGLKPVQWLETKGVTNIAIIIGNTWVTVGLCVIVFMAGLQAIPQELFEAARIDGASSWKQVRYITIPLMSTSITINAITTTIAAFRAYELPYLISQGKPGKSTLMMTQRIYFYGFTAHDYGRGSAIAVMLTLIIVIISLIQLVILRRREDIY